MGLPQGHSSSQALSCSSVGLFHGLWVDLCIPAWVAGAELLHHSLNHGLQGNLHSGT